MDVELLILTCLELQQFFWLILHNLIFGDNLQVRQLETASFYCLKCPWAVNKLVRAEPLLNVHDRDHFLARALVLCVAVVGQRR